MFKKTLKFTLIVTGLSTITYNVVTVALTKLAPHNEFAAMYTAGYVAGRRLGADIIEAEAEGNPLTTEEILEKLEDIL